MAADTRSSNVPASNEAPPRAGWRVKVALVMFVVSLGWPLFMLVLPVVGVPAKAVAAISGVMLVAAEIMLVAAAAIAGKEGFAYIKRQVFGFLKSYAPPKTVSRTRYSIGLVMFAASLLFGWVSPYIGQYIPGFQEHPVAYAIAFDIVFVSSLFVLGGDFWDKLRSLFSQSRVFLKPFRPRR